MPPLPLAHRAFDTDCVVSYQHVMKAEMKGFHKCASAVNTERGKGTVWWESVLAALPFTPSTPTLKTPKQ